MKILGTILVVILLVAVGCNAAIPTKEAADDLMTTPGGWVYRANVHQGGVENPWPPIEGKKVDFTENISVSYRSYIETPSGETRNNIIYIVKLDPDYTHSPSVTLSTSNMTTGIEVKEGDPAGAPQKVDKVLMVNVSKSVKPGEYTFDIGLVIDGKDYGKLPCTINVTK